MRKIGHMDILAEFGGRRELKLNQEQFSGEGAGAGHQKPLLRRFNSPAAGVALLSCHSLGT